MAWLGEWAGPVLVVGGLGALTLGFALMVGRWIDSQSQQVVDEPRKGRRTRE